MAAHVLHHALHRAGDCIGTAAGQGVAGVGREVAHFTGRYMQAGRARFERLEHDAVTGQYQAAQKPALGVDGLHGDRRSDHRDHRGPRRALRQTAVPGTNHRNPAVRAEPGRKVVAIGQAGLGLARHHPARRHVPQFHLFFDPPLDGVAGHHAAQHGGRACKPGPWPVGQFVDVLQKLGAMRQQSGLRVRCLVVRPFEPRVADIECEKGHAGYVSVVWRVFF